MATSEPKKNGLIVIAGPCSINYGNVEDIYKISDIDGIFGVRIVGLKSRTSLNQSGEGMGIDYASFTKNLDRVAKKKSFEKMEDFPSHKIAKEFIKTTGKLVATEIMDPLIQLPSLEKHIPKGKLLIWNPAVSQLGWPAMIMGSFAKKNDWYIGLKNGKWLGSPDKPDNGETPMEKHWAGLAHYTRYH